MAEVLSVLFFDEMHQSLTEPRYPSSDRLVLSKVRKPYVRTWSMYAIILTMNLDMLQPLAWRTCRLFVILFICPQSPHLRPFQRGETFEYIVFYICGGRYLENIFQFNIALFIFLGTRGSHFVCRVGCCWPFP